ncbi:MAG TPA: hypothetical protein VFQ45_08420 [Longimicrobium sp.]|nr:hypothetical protein [Longimicrobium sp.]
MRKGAGAAGGRAAGAARRLTAAALLLLGALLSPAPTPAQTDTLSAGTVRVLHHPRHAGRARQVLAEARRPMALPGFGAGAVPESTTIVLAPSPAAFAAATGGETPEWAGGVASPSRRLIVLPAYPVPGVRTEDAASTLRHEVAHLALHARLPGPIPRWFDEGYAEIAAGGWSAEQAWTLRLAFLLGRAPPLDSLELGWPRMEGRARLAYLLSATAVDHLRRRSGEEGFALLLRNWRVEGSLDRAVRVTFGITPGQLEQEWKRDVKRRYGWLAVGANLGLLWFLVALLTLALWFPKRRRNRARVEAMREDELRRPPPEEQEDWARAPRVEEWVEDDEPLPPLPDPDHRS